MASVQSGSSSSSSTAGQRLWGMLGSSPDVRCDSEHICRILSPFMVPPSLRGGLVPLEGKFEHPRSLPRSRPPVHPTGRTDSYPRTPLRVGKADEFVSQYLDGSEDVDIVIRSIMDHFDELRRKKESRRKRRRQRKRTLRTGEERESTISAHAHLRPLIKRAKLIRSENSAFCSPRVHVREDPIRPIVAVAENPSRLEESRPTRIAAAFSPGLLAAAKSLRRMAGESGKGKMIRRPLALKATHNE